MQCQYVRVTRTDVTPSLAVTADIILRRFMLVLFSFSKNNKPSVNTTQDIPTVKNISNPYNTHCGDVLFIASIDSCNIWHSPVRQYQASSFCRLINMLRKYMCYIVRRLSADSKGTFKTGHYTADGHQHLPRHIPLTVCNDDANEDDDNSKHRFQYGKNDTSYSGCGLEERLSLLKFFVGLLFVSTQTLGWSLRPTVCSGCDHSTIYSPS